MSAFSSRQLSNPSWYCVAGLRPRLASHAQIQRQGFRDGTGYVLHNRVSGRFYRFSRSVQHFTALMDGTRTVQELQDATNAVLGEDALTQDQVIELLGRLYSAEVLQSDVPADAAELFQRHSRHQRVRWTGRMKNPLAIRLPLFDPDALLQRLLPFGRIVFSRIGAWLWLVVVGLALMLTMMHWPEISQTNTIEILSPQNLFLLGVCYPLIKSLHELAHGLATRVWGGEVHETGVMLLAFFPLP